MKKLLLCLFAAVFMLNLSACSGTKVTRVSPDEVVDLSGNWNDTDSQEVSKEMISEVLTYAWYADFMTSRGKKPTVIVGSVLNKTEEHIATETFVKDLERSLINTGKVVFVASKDQRDEIRAEREDQAVNAKASTIKQTGQETGADFMLKGQINSIFDTGSGAEVKYYQVELEMIDMESNEKVWMGQKKIKKVVAKRRYKA
ncbi:MAG: penicillin-binding protein activator LpoB [Endomicrobium sp.]|nr:penicillin-binding protein activator LpoB [Endomicrobium sp.]